MVLLVLNSGLPGPPEPSLKGRLHHSAATAKAASSAPSERVDLCACASLLRFPPFPRLEPRSLSLQRGDAQLGTSAQSLITLRSTIHSRPFSPERRGQRKEP